MSLMNRPFSFGYSKIRFHEDPDEIQHRRAQFLIYKVLKKADARRNRPSWLRFRVLKLKVKIGKRLKKMRRRYSSSLVSAKADLFKQISAMLKPCRFLMQAK